MIVQCIDGFFYQNPRFENERAAITFKDGDCMLIRKGKVTWKTAVRELTALGVKARNSHPDWKDSITNQIIGGSLVECSWFPLRLYKPIPVPTIFDARIENPASDDEEIIRFSKRQSK